jgi:hypothetical protein
VATFPVRSGRKSARLLVIAAASLSLLLQGLSIPMAAHAATLTTVGDFETGADGWGFYPQPGATGSFTQVTSDAFSGTSSGQASFTVNDTYVELAKDVSLDIESLTFAIKSTQLTGIAVRFIDSNGQAFQHVLAADPGAAGWQEFTINDPAVGAALHFPDADGPDDGVWQGPATKIAFLVDGSQVTDRYQPATYLLDAVVATVAETPVAAPPVVPNSVLVGGFESDAEGWGVYPQAGAVDGDFQRVDAGDTSGGMAGEVTVDLSGAGTPTGYVELARDLPNLDLAGLAFSVRSSQLTSIAVRFIDSTGQAFQHYRDLNPSAAGWQTFTVADPAVGAAFHFPTGGSPNDGVWRGPATKVAVLVDAGQLVDPTQPASYLLDAVQAILPPPPSATIGDFEFDTENWSAFPVAGAASGSMQRVTGDSVTGTHAARVSLDVSTGGYVELTRALAGVDISDLHFSVKSTEIKGISVRLKDSTGQFFQHAITLNPTAADWQAITIANFAAANQGHWEGANDGVWHGPATAISFNVDGGQVVDPTQPAEYLLDAVGGTLIPADLVFTSTTLGNVFTVGDPVSVDFETTVPNLSWTLTNATGSVVLTGSGTSAALDGTLPLAVTTPGWYELEVTASEPGGESFTESTTLAIIADFDRDALKDTRFGVATHFGQDWDPAIVPLIEQAGFGSIRDEAYWDQQEAVPGTIAVTPKVQAYEAAVNAANIDLLLVLSYGNPAYDDNKAPTTEAGITAFGRYADAMVDHFGTDDTNYEVWNEWNIHFGAGPANSLPSTYFNLLKETYATIKATNPDAEVIGPVTAQVPMEWIREFFELGGLEYIDALSVHPYTYPAGPEQLDETIADLNALMDEFGEIKPIVISEVGWPSGSAARSIDELTQARYLVQSETIALSNGVQQYFIYNFMNKGVDPLDTEHNFGLIHNPADAQGAYTPKPSYVSIATAHRLLADKEALGEETLTDGVSDYRFDSGAGESLHVLWAGDPQSVSFTASGPVTVTDLFGAVSTLQPDQNGRVTVTAGPSPQYVDGPISDVENGGTHGFSVDPGFVGFEVTGHWTIDNSDGSETLDATLEVEGQTLEATVPAGETDVVDVTLPGLNAPGSRTYSAIVREGDEIVAQLSATASITNAVSFSAVHALAADGSEVLRLRVSNASDIPQQISELSWNIGGTMGSALAGASVPAGGSLAHDVPLGTLTAATDYSAEVEMAGGLVLNASGTLHPVGELSSAAYNTLTVDGVLDGGLDPATGITFPVGGVAPELPGWAGPEDLSGQMWFTWDEENLYVSADVIDNVHAQPATNGNIWQGDSLQIAVGTGAPGDAIVWNELGFALTEEGSQSHQWFQPFSESAPQIDVNVTRDDATHHTVYEAAVPWSRLVPAGTDGRLVSIGAVFNDNDGSGRRGWIAWGGGIAGTKTSAEFKAVRLLEADVLTATVDPAVPNGANGWYSSGPVTVTLSSANGNPLEQRISTPSNPDGMWVEYDGPIQLLTDGDYTIGYRVAGDDSATTSVAVRLDSTAPQVTATADETARTVTLEATDANAGEGLAIEYSLDGGTTWLEYTTAVVVGDEEQTVHYRATDAAGNTSAAQSVTVPEAVPTVEVVTAPTISGKAQVGKKLTASSGTWSVENPTLSYQWYRDGSPIAGATDRKYKLTSADAGAAITVVVTAAKTGYVSGSAGSEPVTVAMLASVTLGTADRLLVPHGSPLAYRVVVFGQDGIVPVGEVKVFDGGALVATAQLTAEDNGRLSIAVPSARTGVHLLTAEFAGSEQLRSSRTLWPAFVLIF